jgi:DNA-binding transcriptional LysR family regulator
MDLIDALRCFIRVVETGSFSAVSRESRISQSAVSRQVAQLEQHFKARLFHRSTRRLNLTDDGQSLLTHARRLMDVNRATEKPTSRYTGGTPIAA